MGINFMRAKSEGKKKRGCVTVLLWLLIICLMLVFSMLLWIPGLAVTLFFAVKKSPNKKRNLLISASVTLISFVLFSFYTPAPPPELTGIKAEWDANEYDITDSPEVKISPVPSTAKIESLTLSDNSIASLKYKNGKAIITFKSEGSEKLYFIANKDINSNSQSIKVIDKEAEAKRIAKEKAEAKRIAEEKAEAKRIAEEKAEAERIAKEKEEEERIAKEKAEAERIAKEQAEAERIAREQAAQAEADRIAREQAAQAEADRIAREQAAAQQPSQEKMVWISETGSKYHSISNCGRMNPDKAYQMPLSQAAKSYEPCSKCN